MVPPAGTDLYNEFVNDAPMINNNGIATMSITDHLPNAVIGIILQDRFVILFYSRIEIYSSHIISPVIEQICTEPPASTVYLIPAGISTLDSNSAYSNWLL